MPKHNSYNNADYKQKQRIGAMGNPYGNEAMRAFAKAREVKFTDDMRQCLLVDYNKGRNMDWMAENLGVALSVLRKEMNRLGLPRGRHVKRCNVVFGV